MRRSRRWAVTCRASRAAESLSAIGVGMAGMPTPLGVSAGGPSCIAPEPLRRPSSLRRPGVEVENDFDGVTHLQRAHEHREWLDVSFAAVAAPDQAQHSRRAVARPTRSSSRDRRSRADGACSQPASESTKAGVRLAPAITPADENQRPAASPQALPLRRHCDHVRVEDVAVASGARQPCQWPGRGGMLAGSARNRTTASSADCRSPTRMQA